MLEAAARRSFRRAVGGDGLRTGPWPVSACYTIVHALRKTWAALLRDGHTNNVRERMVDFDEFNNPIGLPQVREAEASYDDFARELVELT